ISLHTRGERPAAIVLADAWFPGWEARVDGVQAPLLRANLAFRAVAVPAGEHEIELRYRPRSLARGTALAALALAALAALAVASRISRGRSSR
ncbi:MAG TPA: YfhO family protein, partial [Myxococcota bacterium]|nr:YfhO family protein [Myxococcota bacterium]